MKQITRFGAYGVVWNRGKLLLTLNKSGPYKGLWGLPGGGIEFGESPEEAFKRELLEEAALIAGSLKFFTTATSTCKYKKEAEWVHFHHVGLIYQVKSTKPMTESIPEEVFDWVSLQTIPSSLTPFAEQVLAKIR